MKEYNIKIDKNFENHFKDLKQVFMSITDNCNLLCSHCLYKPWLSKKGRDIPINVACSLAKLFREMGAIKISLLGGEPTLYGHFMPENDLGYLVNYLKIIGYKYIRIVSNGYFVNNNHIQSFKHCDEVTLSFDGMDPKAHDAIRGSGTFKKTMNNLKKLIDNGINIHITYTVNKYNLKNKGEEAESINEAIIWAQKLGVKCINFHPIFKMGIDRDKWIMDTDIDIQTWIKIYNTIYENISNSKYAIDVRLPQRFINMISFKKKSELYSYCPVKMGERVEVHPNGLIQICALLKGTNYSIANYNTSGSCLNIKWNNQNTNEIGYYKFDMNKPHPCSIIKSQYKQYVPLCISFKPKQKEIVWNNINISK